MAFDETWLVAVTRKRLAGEAPRLVPGASLAAVGGKLLLHHGGAEEKGAARQATPRVREFRGIRTGNLFLWLWRQALASTTLLRRRGARAMHSRVLSETKATLAMVPAAHHLVPCAVHGCWLLLYPQSSLLASLGEAERAAGGAPRKLWYMR